MQKIAAIIQARMGSTRLPGKVLMDLCGRPVLEWVVKRAASACFVDQVIVATTTDVEDEPIVRYCLDHQIECFRGNSTDVLDRFYQTARQFKVDLIVRITADCPLVDPSLIDKVVELYLSDKVDFAATRLPPPFKRTYPIGQDIEVVSFKLLKKAWKTTKNTYEREHVMPFFYQNPGEFRIATLECEHDYGKQRWTVDTAEDMEFLRAVTQKLDCQLYVCWKEIIQVLKQYPHLLTINKDVIHKTYKEADTRTEKKNHS